MTQILTVSALGKTYGRDQNAHVALADIEFEVRRGEFVSVVGPSGCGKTTLLKCISGLLKPSSGRVELHGQPVLEPPTGMALVFQDYNRSLYPWLTVEKNVALPLEARGLDSRTRRQRVHEALDAVGLEHTKRRRPYQLSGGMQQRVAIARALAYRPEILLMDEPFASIDAQTRAELEDLTLRTRDQFGITVLFVTHDIDEAVYLADRIVVLTPPPAGVKEIVTCDLPRPRDQIQTKELAQFASLRGYVYRAVTKSRETPEGSGPSEQLHVEAGVE
ncbi:MAG: ATP-binding cassette domain-containing protein [Streptosporangiales bacterium]|nr:ATP-binding cassette domain-containing protein [Streptosporangiales bacterium]